MNVYIGCVNVYATHIHTAYTIYIWSVKHESGPEEIIYFIHTYTSTHTAPADAIDWSQLKNTWSAYSKYVRANLSTHIKIVQRCFAVFCKYAVNAQYGYTLLVHINTCCIFSHFISGVYKYNFSVHVINYNNCLNYSRWMHTSKLNWLEPHIIWGKFWFSFDKYMINYSYYLLFLKHARFVFFFFYK